MDYKLLIWQTINIILFVAVIIFLILLVKYFLKKRNQ